MLPTRPPQRMNMKLLIFLMYTHVLKHYLRVVDEHLDHKFANFFRISLNSTVETRGPTITVMLHNHVLHDDIRSHDLPQLMFVPCSVRRAWSIPNAHSTSFLTHSSCFVNGNFSLPCGLGLCSQMSSTDDI
jgi:hypothetical protein